jgi:hypothetical protein
MRSLLGRRARSAHERREPEPAVLAALTGGAVSVEWSDAMTNFVAWWGAIVATLVLLWDIYKWRIEGPIVRGRAFAFWLQVGDPSGGEHLVFRLNNNGSRPTTIESLGVHYYPNGRSKKDAQSFILKPGPLAAYPDLLAPGHVWSAISLQDEKMSALLRTGNCFAVVGLSHLKKGLEIPIDILGGVGSGMSSASGQSSK